MQGGHACERDGCRKEAKMQCPTCLKMRCEPSYFCSQDCFRAAWATHKSKHELPKEPVTLTDLQRMLAQAGMAKRVVPGKVTPMRTVPPHIARPDHADGGKPLAEIKSRMQHDVPVLTADEIEKMRILSRLGREVLDLAHRMVRPGVTTEEIDAAVHQACIDRECYPSPLNYWSFPKSCCTSVNEVICHGIPDSRPLEEGDIVNVDISVYKFGLHSDLNETYYVGKVDEASKRLVRCTYDCVMEAIKICKPGTLYREVGNVISQVATQRGFSVVRSYCGHGVGRLFHDNPSVPHYAKNKAVGVMKPGHVFTIEPMINEGTWKDNTWPDGWTSVTQDYKRSAQFEHAILITETGAEILTGPIETSPTLECLVDPPATL